MTIAECWLIFLTLYFPEALLVDESTDFDQLSSTLSDLLLAATICKVDIVPWLLDQLSSRLRTLAKSFEPVVPEGLYLPAPPVYCPQPAMDTEVGKCASRMLIICLIALLFLSNSNYNGYSYSIPLGCYACQCTEGSEVTKGNVVCHNPAPVSAKWL